MGELIGSVPGVPPAVPGLPPVEEVARRTVDDLHDRIVPVPRGDVVSIAPEDFRGDPTKVPGHPSNPNSLQAIMQRSKPGLPKIGLTVDVGSSPDGSVTGRGVKLNRRNTAVGEVTYDEGFGKVKPTINADEALSPSESPVNNEALDSLLDSMGGTAAEVATGPAKAVPAPGVGMRTGYFSASTEEQRAAADGSGVDLGAHDTKYNSSAAGQDSN